MSSLFEHDVNIVMPNPSINNAFDVALSFCIIVYLLGLTKINQKQGHNNLQIQEINQLLSNKKISTKVYLKDSK
ncbi:predicted protein [Francisella philomiragia subsp. philomiragia ATCC 25015]|nr:predicted protein [Francisella philomiragia subsp. philomiragia ATCC 25015]